MRRFAALRAFSGLTVLLALLLAVALGTPTPAASQGPEDRPTVQPPTPTPLPSLTTGLPPSIHGVIINWGFRNEPNVPIRASGADWYLDTASDTTGYFVFERLGNDVILLNIVAPQDSPYQPLTADVAVRPIAGDETVVNLGVYEGEQSLPLPVTHTMQASATEALPGDRVTFTAHIKNNLETAITHVQLTNLIPSGLGYVSAESDHGPVDYADNLVIARLGTLGPDEEAIVSFVTLVEPNHGESWELTNRSSLLYRESAATQATVTLSVSRGPADELPVTGIGIEMPLTGLGLAALLLIARRLRTHTLRA